jgi:hypothetical protein
MEHIFAIGLGIWSALLTAFVGVVGFIAREKKLTKLLHTLTNALTNLKQKLTNLFRKG